MDISSIKPQGPWVLVRVFPPPTESKGGIILPLNNSDEIYGQAAAEVVAVGQGKRNEGKAALRSKYFHSGLNPGDKVYFRRFLKDANKVPDLGDDYSMVHQDDIQLVVEED